ncbi:MAG: DUF1007 family protein [Campylobacterales bacterium]|nr:DUF1007 family protein [Campylobacterales bacterium]
MKKLLLLTLLLSQTLLFSCATCQLMIPTVEMHIKLEIDKTKLHTIHMQWNFSDTYSAEMITQYDKNKNKILDEKELAVIQKAMLDYLVPKKMLTKIMYDSVKTSDIEPKYKNFSTKMVNGFLVFSYDAEVAIDVKENASLSFAFEDNESYFSFVVTKLNVSENDFSHTQNLYLFTASVLFHMPTSEATNALGVPTSEVINAPKVPTQNEVKKESNQTKKEIITAPQENSTQANLLKESIVKIKSLFESIKDEKNPLTYMALLLFAYLYGLIHALGPGHGKTLVTSYFLSNERSYSKAFFVSLAIGVVHTFSAFILTLVIYFLVNTFLAQFLNDAVLYTTKISAVIIIFIALYLIYKKYKVYKQIQQEQTKPTYSFSTTPHISACGCASCKVDNNSTDMALIISAGIIPCPGTVTIFIFSLSLGLYYAGFLSAFVMSLGMSTIIFFSAMLSVAVRKKTSNSTNNVKKYLEYASLCVILVLGIVLLFT